MAEKDRVLDSDDFNPMAGFGHEFQNIWLRFFRGPMTPATKRQRQRAIADLMESGGDEFEHYLNEMIPSSNGQDKTRAQTLHDAAETAASELRERLREYSRVISR